MAPTAASRFSISARNFWLWFGSLWLAVGLLFLVIGIAVGVSQRGLGRRFQAEARDATGLVLTKSILSSSNARGPTCWVTYRFATADGRIVKGSGAVSADTWDRLTERGPIRIRYLPERPAQHRVEDGPVEADPAIALVFTAGGGALAALGGFVVLRWRSRLRRAARLERRGTLADATVLGVEPTRITINRTARWAIRYRYDDDRGRSHEGRSEPLDRDETLAWTPGTRGAVRFDPARPGESVWLGRP